MAECGVGDPWDTLLWARVMVFLSARFTGCVHPWEGRLAGIAGSGTLCMTVRRTNSRYGANSLQMTLATPRTSLPSSFEAFQIVVMRSTLGVEGPRALLMSWSTSAIARHPRSTLSSG